MVTSAARARLSVVLVGARNPQNIGAAARAMQDFGFSDLRIVNPFAPPFEAARLEAKSAVGAADVMEHAQLFASLPAAIADCSLVVGTTAIGDRGLTQPVQTLQDAAATLREHLSAANVTSEAQAAGPRVALLFGSEKTGLTREQLSFCSALLTIPLFAPQGRHLSMNLGQAVAVCLYELTRSGFEGARELPLSGHVAATVEDQERLLTLVLEVMQRFGYCRRFPANSRPEVVRQLLHPLGRTRDEAATWMGLFRQLLRQPLRAEDGDSGIADPEIESIGP